MAYKKIITKEDLGYRKEEVDQMVEVTQTVEKLINEGSEITGIMIEELGKAIVKHYEKKS